MADNEWKHPDSPAPKKFRSTLSAGKVMATVFWYKAGAVHVDFLPSGTAIDSAYYCQVLRDLHKELGWELLPHPPYSPDLAPSRFHLFEPLKAFLGGRHFSCDDEVKNAIRSWLLCVGQDFYAAGIEALEFVLEEQND
ncbi:histone-lysine N-methyltransferase SETMAR-like [Ornithodoros turicata]|uniref:histone-lysine N-methyltransferase SETMAR-like n=1 Tax=Ornithodoros turicata TaxID=34597 RepID=UPI003139BD4A